MNTRAASKLLNDFASPAHILEKTSSKVLTRMTGRRPNVFANGTHHKLDTPSMIRFTATRYVTRLKPMGGNPKIGVAA